MSLNRMFVIIALSLIALSGSANAQDKFFTVRDSIEMSIFIDPETRVGDGRDADVRWSPDGRHFAVVTARGVIESNQIESTVWVFDSEEGRNVLLSQGAEKTLLPRVVARLAAVTNDRALISDLRWSSDSKRIFFLGQGSTRERRLYQAAVSDDAVHSLTPKDTYVSLYNAVGSTSDTLVYTASSRNEDLEKVLKGHPINPSARAVTGMPLSAILFPNFWLESDFLKSHELWRIRDGTNKRIIDPGSRQPVKVISVDDGYGNILSPSPDGRLVIVLRPINSWNPEWDGYVPDNPHAKFHANRSGTEFFTYWAELPAEYALVDLDTGNSKSLVNAPFARFQGFGQSTKAMWSADGKKALLGATYLPLAGVEPEERSRRSRPCAAAVVEIQSSKVTCVTAMSRTTDPNGLLVRDLSFGKSDQEVTLRMVTIDNKGEQTEIYEEQGGAWKRVTVSSEHDPGIPRSPGAALEDSENGRLRVFVHQGLNQPPALFATDPIHGQPRKIWDPNPQLSMMNLGQASVLRWKDPGGREWVAGLVKPPDYVAGKKYPLVIQTHGFVENSFLTDGGYTSALAARPLASAGILVLQVPHLYEHLATAQELPEHIAGFESALDLLASKELIDPARVGIIGFSRTGYHVEGALIKDPTRFAAATIADGSDESYVQYLTWVGSVAAPEEEAIYGAKPFGEGLKAWLKSAPGFNLDKIRTPLRIEAISGLVAVLNAWEMYASLYLQGKPVDLIFFPDGVHVLEKPLERLASQQGNVDWFRFWLKGEEDPDPAKAEQYVRWHELRKMQEENEKRASGQVTGDRPQ